MGFTPAVDPTADKAPPPPRGEQLKCPRCESTNTKFCYYNNYSRAQPRHFCKSCKRHWTAGGALRNVPVGGCRKAARRPRPPPHRPSPGPAPHRLSPPPVLADDWSLPFPLLVNMMATDEWGPVWDIPPLPPPPPLPFDVSSSSSASSGCWGGCWDELGGLYTSDFAKSPSE